MRHAWCLFLALVWGCSQDAERTVRALNARSKPQAPILVKATSRALAPGVYEVEASVTPTSAVGHVTIDALLPRGAVAESQPSASFGATGRGVTRRMTVRVGAAEPAEVIVRAHVGIAGGVRSRGTIVRLGNTDRVSPHAAPAPAATVTLPGGARVAVVRSP
ncbi:MAG: hypothetical protein HY698_03520 [Deltaproteobacteria bacterium]|nr:hypothetical protein [Deltaproteobacteria bacterium]